MSPCTTLTAGRIVLLSLYSTRKVYASLSNLLMLALIPTSQGVMYELLKCGYVAAEKWVTSAPKLVNCV